MFDLDKIVDDVQPTDELEDVVMGLIINAGQA
ncbi:PTS N N'-diacetylchitobiose transporter subunit IIA, partial [Yersinia enterocolitica]